MATSLNVKWQSESWDRLNRSLSHLSAGYCTFLSGLGKTLQALRGLLQGDGDLA